MSGSGTEPTAEPAREAAPPPPSRSDVRARLSVCLVFVVMGSAMGGWSARIPDVRRGVGLGRHRLGAGQRHLRRRGPRRPRRRHRADRTGERPSAEPGGCGPDPGERPADGLRVDAGRARGRPGHLRLRREPAVHADERPGGRGRTPLRAAAAVDLPRLLRLRRARRRSPGHSRRGGGRGAGRATGLRQRTVGRPAAGLGPVAARGDDRPAAGGAAGGPAAAPTHPPNSPCWPPSRSWRPSSRAPRVSGAPSTPPTSWAPGRPSPPPPTPV